MRTLLKFLAVASMAFYAAAPAHAQTINDIVNNKKIVIGIVTDYPPFGFLDEKQQPTGYDVDLSNMIAKALGVDLELVPVANANRIPFLVTKKIDILVADLGITPERAKQVMFTSPYSGASSIVVAPGDQQLTTLQDLVGKKVGVARSSSNDIFFSQVAREGTQIMRFDGESTTAQALISGQIDAMVASNSMIEPLIAKNPDKNLKSHFTIQVQADAIAVRKDAFELAQWINSYLYYLKTNGELAALYKKWVGSDIPDLPAL
jgi:polar amino acid transport system substrate-binding protein